MDERPLLMGIDAVFCSREHGADSRPQLADVRLGDLDEQLMAHHQVQQVINLFRQ